MQGWVISPRKKPEKSKEELRKERDEKVRRLIGHGYLRKGLCNRCPMKCECRGIKG
jgi:hypothetical protein